MNRGKSAGQTVMHAYFHLIPRRDDDLENPRGEVGVLFLANELLGYRENQIVRSLVF